MKHDINALGYTSWAQLWDELVANQLHEEDRIQLVYPSPEEGDEPTPDVTLSMEYIRSEVFLEKWETLPTKQSVEVVIDLVKSMNAKQGYTTPIIEFLTKLPTRSQ